MAAPAFNLITELQVCIRRDFPVAVESILSPLDSAALLEGEWLELDANYMLKRGAAAVGAVAAVFPVHTERGRYETQAIKKTNVIFAGQYEAETLVHLADLTGYVAGDPLHVGDVSYAGYATRRGLIKATVGTAIGTPIVGWVTKITGTGATAQLRFLHTGVSNFAR
jgi:hypothetical protein